MDSSSTRRNLRTRKEAAQRTWISGAASAPPTMRSIMSSPGKRRVIWSVHVLSGFRTRSRRSWSHGEISQLAEHVVGRAEVLSHAPDAALPRQLERLGPLLDVVANDAALVDSLQSFNDMQELRHEADYDHGRRFSRLHLVEACDSARLARRRLGDASSASREALFTLLTVRRADFRQR